MSKGYIDKEKVLSELCSDCKGIAYCRVPCALYNYIDNSSPADVKPVVRGEWITVSESAWDGNEYKCSACGWECCDSEFGDDPTEDYRFCPNCGADMRKEENDER